MFPSSLVQKEGWRKQHKVEHNWETEGKYFMGLKTIHLCLVLLSRCFVEPPVAARLSSIASPLVPTQHGLVRLCSQYVELCSVPAFLRYQASGLGLKARRQNLSGLHFRLIVFPSQSDFNGELL
ncbi:hypothetical protein AMECASPLE_006042 [Ameca splendens]|uniref:Uncharacterized protein n=1 Tax=Ameca splendens TaxID=208324 RepID=A0ABV0YML9_9TELE